MVYDTTAASVCPHLLRTELVCAGHEVRAEQREADGVAALGGKLQALLKHLFKRTAVETMQTKITIKNTGGSTYRKRDMFQNGAVMKITQLTRK